MRTIRIGIEEGRVDDRHDPARGLCGLEPRIDAALFDAALESLSEIYKLLGVVDKDEVRCQDMFEFVSKKQKEVQKQIEDLKRIETMLDDLKKRCPDEKQLHSCPIIETLT
ncbi:MerR family DNA-binding protein [Nocardia sp. NPDC004604]|uniref:MerR family DNA-binding protein n=1 Tax=Nocardia sp. NPDC004604 TaxID=3157013 RepID=UPI0033B21B15